MRLHGRSGGGYFAPVVSSLVSAKTWFTIGVVSLLLVAGAAGKIAYSWFVWQRQSDEARYYWDRGRCYRVQIEKGGMLTRAQVESPGLCPSIDWEHRQKGMEWRALVECHYDSCVPSSLLQKSPRHATSYIGAGPSQQESCQTAESDLRDIIRVLRCRATACTCPKADYDAARP